MFLVEQKLRFIDGNRASSNLFAESKTFHKDVRGIWLLIGTSRLLRISHVLKNF